MIHQAVVIFLDKKEQLSYFVILNISLLHIILGAMFLIIQHKLGRINATHTLLIKKWKAK